MVYLSLYKNLVQLNKAINSDYKSFVTAFLTKYESVTKVDYMNSTKAKKRFKSVKELRFLYTEDTENIYFSRGILELIPTTFYKIIDQIDDHLVQPNPSIEDIKHSLDVFDLRDDQIIAVRKCLYAKRGIIQLPTAVGKSAIIASTIKQLQKVNPKMKFLVLAPTLSTVENINDTFLTNNMDTAIFAHPDKEVKTSITTSLVQSLIVESQNNPNLLTDIDAVFYDECLAGNVKILLADGSWKTISSIYDNNDIQEVLSYNIENNTYETKKILRKFKTPFNQKFCRVYFKDKETDQLKGITCTPNHKIWTRNRGYISAEELTSDDYIKIDYWYTREFSYLADISYSKVERISFNIGNIAAYKYNLEIEDNHNYFADRVLVSNCHHLKCETWNKLNTLLPNAEYSLGFSALSIDKKEIYEQDFRNISYDASLIIGSCGKVLLHMDPSYYIERGIIALPVVMRINHYETLPSNIDESNWAKINKLGLMSTLRTNKIAATAAIFAKYRRKILILVSEREYAFTLGRFLYQYGITKYGISFGAGEGYIFNSALPKEDNDFEIKYTDIDSLETIKKLGSGELDILIATNHTDEGVDIPGLDGVILANGGKKDRRIIQRLGRVLRKSKNGKYAYVIDFTDTGIKVLSRQSRSRLRLYKEDIGVPKENIFDNINLEDVENTFKRLESIP